MAAKPKVASLKIPPVPVDGLFTAENYNADESVAYLVASLRTRIFKAVDIEMGRLGFTAAQWTILRHLATSEPPTAAELCRLMNYDTGSMTRMLTRLERKGVVARIPSEQDRRVIQLKLTPAGRKLYPKLLDVVIRVLNHLTHGMTLAEVQHLSQQLMRMRNNLRDAYGADL